jgi:hypothetical protein
MACINGGALCEQLAKEKLISNSTNNHWGAADACIDTANILVFKPDLNEPSSFLFDVSKMYQWHLLDHYATPVGFRKAVMGIEENSPDKELMAYPSRQYVVNTRSQLKYRGSRHIALMNASDILKFLHHKLQQKEQKVLHKTKPLTAVAVLAAEDSNKMHDKDQSVEPILKKEHDGNAEHKEAVLEENATDANQKLFMVSDAVQDLYKRCQNALLLPEEPYAKRRRVRKSIANECKMLTFTACSIALKDLHAQMHAI